MRKTESGSIRMSKPYGAVAPIFKPSVPLFHGGCTVLSIQPSTSILSEKALAALKYAFLQNKKVGITGSKVDSLKPPCNSDLDKAEASYSIARELVQWSEKFVIDDEASLTLPSPQVARLETEDDHKMSDKKFPDAGVCCLDSKDDKEVIFGDTKRDPEIKGPEIKDPEVKLEDLDEFKEYEYRSNLQTFEPKVDPILIKRESESLLSAAATKRQVVPSRAARAGCEATTDFLKDTCDGFDFFNSDTDYSGINFLSFSSNEPMSSLDDLIQHTVDIDIAFPVPPLPIIETERFDDPASPIESPNSPLLLSPFSTSPHSPLCKFPDS